MSAIRDIYTGRQPHAPAVITRALTEKAQDRSVKYMYGKAQDHVRLKSEACYHRQTQTWMCPPMNS